MKRRPHIHYVLVKPLLPKRRLVRQGNNQKAKVNVLSQYAILKDLRKVMPNIRHTIMWRNEVWSELDAHMVMRLVLYEPHVNGLACSTRWQAHPPL